MKEKEEEKLVTMVIRVPKYKKEMIKNIAKVKEDMKQILLEVYNILKIDIAVVKTSSY